MDFIYLLKEYWTIITAFVSIVGFYYKTRSEIQSLNKSISDTDTHMRQTDDKHEEDIKDIFRQITKDRQSFVQMQIDIKGIQTTLEFIRERISEKK